MRGDFQGFKCIAAGHKDFLEKRYPAKIHFDAHRRGAPLFTADEQGKLALLHHGSRIPKGSPSRKVDSLTTWRSMQGDALLAAKQKRGKA